jgi:hypothetical protein
MYVRLGNVAAREGIKTGKSVKWRKIEGNQVTTFSIEDERPLDIAFTEVKGGWDWHSSKAPAWIDSDNHELLQMLAEHWNCAVGQPSNWH